MPILVVEISLLPLKPFILEAYKVNCYLNDENTCRPPIPWLVLYRIITTCNGTDCTQYQISIGKAISMQSIPRYS